MSISEQIGEIMAENKKLQEENKKLKEERDVWRGRHIFQLDGIENMEEEIKKLKRVIDVYESN